MTRGELALYRAEEKTKERIQKVERESRRKIREFKEQTNTILDAMAAILMILMTIAAFFIDAFGFAKIPTWIYVIAIAYLVFYIYWRMKDFE